MEVISNLLNETSQSFANKKISMIPIDEIHPNKLNKAPIDNINDLIASIKESKLQTPLSVYKEENHHYIILNGERRYTALKDMGVEEVPVIIEQKPEDEVSERLIIMDANAQRDESKEYKIQRAEEYANLYILLKEQNKISPGTLKIDWIGLHMNISGRQVQRYLSEKSVHGHDDHVKNDLSVYDDLKDHMQRKLGTQVKFKKNHFVVSFADIEDLNRLLAILEMDNVVNE